MVTSADVVNRALEVAARNVQVTGTNPTFDGTPAGNAAGVLYTPAVNLVMRQLDPAFARRTLTLTPVAGTIPPPWTHEYTYPTDCLRLRGLAPASPVANDPTPIRGQVAFDNGLAVKVIVCNIAAAVAKYTSSGPTETQWDWAFADAVAKRLANPLSMALAGRPDFARELLQEAEQAAAAADLIDEV
jgi:hypothetical protein